eukprot:CAMPEP_0202978666 /NCGR_PEP_ID=MMETSP1396-20130829/85015_1 /ASSEMBLY_ACC=CAM_ASM_000872 /TAXON_ID= /ORGANISM="Pseudokeronopsis sp., Strain Brazil" /LENGTH=71 /DNA_ID=CAMNT_0049717719 /DNA_START=241 /DNA_END=456 /DNA_ORIENTATION=-
MIIANFKKYGPTGMPNLIAQGYSTTANQYQTNYSSSFGKPAAATASAAAVSTLYPSFDSGPLGIAPPLGLS